MSTTLRKAVTRIILDVASPDVQKAVSVTQGDVNRKFEITLVDGGRPFPLQPKWTAALVGIKPDGKNLFNSCVVDETGKIVYDFAGGEEIATAAGGYAIYFEIYDEVGDTLASPSIWLTVIPFPSRDMASEDQYTAAREIIRRLNEAEGHIETIEGEIDEIQERLDEKDKQVAEIFARMTRVAMVTIPKSEWTDGDPIQAEVKLPDVVSNSVAFLVPADDTTRMTASEAGLTTTISTLDKDGDTIFVTRGAFVPIHDMHFLCFVMQGEAEEETAPTASFVGISGGGSGGSTPIADDLVTNATNWALSAAQGVVLKGMADEAKEETENIKQDLEQKFKDGGPLGIEDGGTGADNVADALANLGIREKSVYGEYTGTGTTEMSIVFPFTPKLFIIFGGKKLFYCPRQSPIGVEWGLESSTSSGDVNFKTASYFWTNNVYGEFDYETNTFTYKCYSTYSKGAIYNEEGTLYRYSAFG